MAYGYQDLFGKIGGSTPYQAFLSNQEKSQDIIGKELSNVLNRIKNQHEEERLKGEIAQTKADTGLKNKQTQWYDKEALAKIGYQQAHGHLMGLQGKEIEAALPYIEMIKKADARQKEMEAQKAQMIMDIINGRLNLQGTQNQPPSFDQAFAQSAPQNASNQAIIPQQSQTQVGMSQTQNVQPNNQLLGNRAVDELIAKFVGIPTHQPHYSSAGEEFYINPLTGQTEVKQVGRTPEDIEFSKTMGTGKAKEKLEFQENWQKILSTELSKGPEFAMLQEAINDPNFYLATDFGSNIVPRLMNKKNVNEVAGVIDTTLGNLIGKTYSGFKGQNVNVFRTLQSMKGDRSNNPFALRAKINTLAAYSDYMNQVAQKAIQYSRSGLENNEAELKAYQDTDFSQVRKQVDNYNTAHSIAHKVKQDYTAVLKKADEIAREKGVDISLVLNEMNKRVQNGK